LKKAWTFEIRDVDLYNKPEDINVTEPLWAGTYIGRARLDSHSKSATSSMSTFDERFPHPQLMPGDPVDRARVRLFLLNFENAVCPCHHH
jgi:RNA polymerase-associated protein